VLIDVRNAFEHSIGHFKGSRGLRTNTFAESWQALDLLVEEESLLTEDKQVLMYCTGGIRCEKASAYLKVCRFTYMCFICK
jgi:UPF0176 protein